MKVLEREQNKELLLLIRNKINVFLDNSPKYFLFIVYLFMFPIGILIVSPFITSPIMELINVLFPMKIINIIVEDKVHYIISGFLLGIFLFPISFFTLGIKYDGKPEYCEFKFLRFLMTIFILPMLFDFIIQIYYLDFSYLTAIYKFIELSQNCIDKIILYTESGYLSIVLPLLPIAFLSILLLKYLVYLLIIGVFNYFIILIKTLYLLQQVGV